ncbi:MAG: hypothetical protein ACTSPB_01250 [Candidatus Thorarchaeota archaeon]
MSNMIRVGDKTLTFEEAKEVDRFMLRYNILRAWGWSHSKAIKKAQEIGDKRK